MNISKNEQLVVDGNSFYEIDLQCVQKKQSQKHIRRNEHQGQSRQPQSADAPPAAPRYAMQKRTCEKTKVFHASFFL